MAITIYPVIMAGGAGTRLWPMSTSRNPKQFQRLLGDRTLFQETVLRVQGAVGEQVRFAAPSVIGGTAYHDQIIDQLDDLGIDPHRVILEPFGRNTAPVAAIASAMTDDPSALVLLLPSDHHMGDPGAFRQAVANAARATLDNGLISTFGIEPTHPETGYGYIRRGAAIDGLLAHCEAFEEKPNLETAIRYLADGQYAWNGGIFLFSPAVMQQELSAHAPAILDASLAALKAGPCSGTTTRLERDAFAACPSDSIDYAVMEKTSRAAVYGPLRCGWSDIGSWSALATLDSAPERGDVITVDTTDCYIRSEDGTLIAAIGVEGLVIIADGDNVLIAPKDRVQDVKAIVGALKSAGRTSKL